MTVKTQTFDQLVANAVAAIQGASSQLIDMSVGSVLRAFVEAVAGLGLWLQGVALQIAARTRFATSNGADADSWAADFGFYRLAARAAFGTATFARFTTTAQGAVPVGTVVQAADGSQKYTVIADTTQTTFNASLQAYILGVGVASCTVTIQSQSASASGNAAAGAINTIGSALAGIDTVTNDAAFVNGADQEGDTAFRARFITYINSLSKATRSAVLFAVTSLQNSASETLTENQTYAGSAQQGYFYVVADDGSGAPSAGFLSNVSNAIDAVRPIGSTFGVFAPVVVSANYLMTVVAGPGYVHADVAAAVDAALMSYINSLPIGAGLAYTRLAQIAYDASPGVANVSGVLLNSGTSDLTATGKQVIKVGTHTIS